MGRYLVTGSADVLVRNRRQTRRSVRASRSVADEDVRAPSKYDVRAPSKYDVRAPIKYDVRAPSDTLLTCCFVNRCDDPV